MNVLIQRQHKFKERELGSVLLISLTILIILTLVTFSSSKNVLLQEKMTSTARQSIAISEAAELALLEGEGLALNGNYSLAGDDANGGDNGFFNGDTVGFFTAPACGVLANCYLTTQQDLFDPVTWAANTADATQGVTLGNQQVTGQFKVIFLGQRNIALATQRSTVVITREYSSKGEGGLGQTLLFKVIGSAVLNGTRKVVVSYFATQASPANSPTVIN